MDTPAVATCPPCAALRQHVCGYWLARANRDSRHAVLPDGSVDVVLEVLDGAAGSWVYGTTSRPIEFAIQPGAHYLGIRFRPGQSRHFIAVPAQELTDRREPAPGLLRFSLDGVAEDLLLAGVSARIDRMLQRHLERIQPEPGRIDQAIAAIEAGDVRMAEVAACFGGSQRQFERVFRATVGLPAKQFASIQRLRRAASFIADGLPLVEAAADAGYADQSHMSNEFRRLAGATPRRFARRAVDFLQD